MELINQKIDDLHRSSSREIAESERKSYSLLQFQPYFTLEKFLGVSRHVEIDGQLRDPKLYQRVYSIILSFTIVISSFQLQSNDNVKLQLNIFRITTHLLNGSIYALFTACNGLFGAKADSMYPFQQLRDLDTDLNILGHRGVHTRRYWREVVVLFLVLLSNSFVILGLATFGHYSISIVTMWFPLLFLEIQSTLCATIVTALKCRLRHLTWLSKTRHQKKIYKKGSQFELCNVRDLNFDKVVSTYEKIMNIYKYVNTQFGLKMLAFLISTSVSTFIALWKLLLEIKSEDGTLINYIIYSMYFCRMFIRILQLSVNFESFTVAVEQFKVHLLEIIHLEHPVWSGEARALLSYSEACGSEFSVCGMFHMDIYLPFSFLVAMLSLYIALVQIILLQT